MSPAFSVTGRRPLFSVVDMVATQPHVGDHVSPDGKTFVMVRQSPPERIMVVQILRRADETLAAVTRCAIAELRL